jgi:hypothetical protein
VPVATRPIPDAAKPIVPYVCGMFVISGNGRVGKLWREAGSGFRHSHLKLFASLLQLTVILAELGQFTKGTLERRFGRKRAPTCLRRSRSPKLTKESLALIDQIREARNVHEQRLKSNSTRSAHSILSAGSPQTSQVFGSSDLPGIRPRVEPLARLLALFLLGGGRLQ